MRVHIFRFHPARLINFFKMADQILTPPEANLLTHVALKEDSESDILHPTGSEINIIVISNALEPFDG